MRRARTGGGRSSLFVSRIAEAPRRRDPEPSVGRPDGTRLGPPRASLAPHPVGEPEVLGRESAPLAVHRGRDVGAAHAEDAVVAGHEEPALVLEDALHEAVVEPLLRPDAGELSVAQPGQSVARPDPQRPLVVEKQGLDPVVGQSVASRPGPEAVSLEEREPGRRPRPDAAAPGGQEAEKPVGGEAVDDAEAPGDPVAKADDAPGENPDPDRPVLVFREGPDVAGVDSRRRERRRARRRRHGRRRGHRCRCRPRAARPGRPGAPRAGRTAARLPSRRPASSVPRSGGGRRWPRWPRSLPRRPA